MTKTTIIVTIKLWLVAGHRDVSAEFREIRDVTGQEYDVRGLEAFTRYELRVVSVNTVGRSQPSHTVDATTSQLGTIHATYDQIPRWDLWYLTYACIPAVHLLNFFKTIGLQLIENLQLVCKK